jgi:hypothetical protein
MKKAGVDGPPVAYTVDGESLQDRNFMREHNAKEFTERKQYAKYGAALSSVTNDLDAGNIHKATKSCVQNIGNK